MKAHTFLSVALAGGFGAAAVTGSATRAAAQTQSGDARIAKTDPCALVTKPEIQTAIEGKRSPTELARLKQKGIAWSISTTSIAQGESRVCQIHWQGTLSGAMHETGDMSIHVSNATFSSARFVAHSGQ